MVRPVGQGAENTTGRQRTVRLSLLLEDSGTKRGPNMKRSLKVGSIVCSVHPLRVAYCAGLPVVMEIEASHVGQ